MRKHRIFAADFSVKAKEKLSTGVSRFLSMSENVEIELWGESESEKPRMRVLYMKESGYGLW